MVHLRLGNNTQKSYEISELVCSASIFNKVEVLLYKVKLSGLSSRLNHSFVNTKVGHIAVDLFEDSMDK